MIIQNSNATTQTVQPELRVREPAPKVVNDSADQAIPQQPSPEQLKSAVETINQVMKQSNNSLEFSVDSDTKRTIVKMVDTATGELIRQFPSDQTLAISREIDRFQQGLLLKQKA